MFILLPLLCFSLFYIIFSKKWYWRDSFLLASLLWGVCVTASTEFLSLIHYITFPGILGFWILTLLISISIVLTLNKGRSSVEPFSLSHLLIHEIILLSGIALIAVMVGWIALTAPPNNWDSMTYHMSRVAHWIQNHSIGNYPSHIIRQLNYTPWAEYAILHFQILSHGDRFANLIQCFSMLGSIIGVSLIARQMGSSRIGQILSSLAAATLPMGILQGSSTQNDYAATFWLVCFVYFLLLLRSDFNAKNSIKVGLSLGLAFLTKGTIYIYTLPFIIWILIIGFKELGWKSNKFFLTIFIAVLLINGSYYARNIDLTGGVLPPSETKSILDKSLNPLTFASRFLLNTALHLGTPFKTINTFVAKMVNQSRAFMGIKNESKFYFPGHPFHEDHAGNVLHFFLIILCLCIFFSMKHEKKVIPPFKIFINDHFGLDYF